MNSTKRSHPATTMLEDQTKVSHKKAKIDVVLLPSELLMTIFRHMPGKVIPIARAVCRRWNRLIIANADKLPKIYIEEISIKGLDDSQLFIEFDRNRRSVEISFEWFLNETSEMRPNMQTLLRHIVVTSRFAFDHCKTLTDAIFDELGECSASFGDRAGVALINVDLSKITPDGLVRFLSSANSLFHFVDIDLAVVQQTFLTDSALTAITGGKLQRFRFVGFTVDKQMRNLYDLKYVTRETMKHFAQLSTSLAEIALGHFACIYPEDIIEFIQTWQANVKARKLTRLTLSCSFYVDYLLIAHALLESSFETQYLECDRMFLIKHSVLRDHTLEICLLAWRQWFALYGIDL